MQCGTACIEIISGVVLHFSAEAANDSEIKPHQDTV